MKLDGPLPQPSPASPREAVEQARGAAAGAPRHLVVKFTADVFQATDQPGYVAGDVVGLPPCLAEHYVDAGVASFDLDAGPRPAPRRPEMYGGTQTAAAGGPVAMKLVKPWGTLVAGDVAGFNAALAHELRVRGIAHPVAAVPLITRTLRSLRDALTRR